MEYRLAESEQDFAIAHALRERVGIPFINMGFPTILADRGAGEIEGVISINIDFEDVVMVEPLVSPNPIVAMRLIQAMENVLGGMGIKVFMLRVKPELESYLAQIRRSGICEELGLDEQKEFYWFKRRLTNESLQSDSS